MPLVLRAGLALLAAALASAGPAAAQDAVADFYRGKQINLVIGSAAGGGYDAYARLIGRHMANHIPGHPTIVPQNMPGAASNRAAGFVYTLAAKDGTTIGAIQPGVILQPLLSDLQVQHEPSKFIYLGSANSDVYLCYVRADTPVARFEDTFTREVIIGSSGEGATTRDLPLLLNSILGTRFRLVAGYAGTREITLAIERGELQGICGMGWTSLATTHPDWVSRSFVRLLAQETSKGHPDLNRMGVPLTVDFARSDDDRQAMELVYSQGVFGRPFLLPPGVPAERAAVLRQAFAQALQDPALLAEAERMRLEIQPMSGDAVQELVARIFALPPRIIERAKQALAAKPAAR